MREVHRFIEKVCNSSDSTQYAVGSRQLAVGSWQFVWANLLITNNQFLLLNLSLSL
jgi:hypothetical protein